MATPIDSQIEEVEKLITKSDNKIVRDALQLQLSALKKKQTGTKNRKAKTKDGVLVGIGDSVFSYTVPRTYENYGQKISKHPALISERLITAVSSSGGQFSFNPPSYGRPSYYASHAFYSTKLAAATACYDEVQVGIERREENIKEANQSLALYINYNVVDADRLLKEYTN